MLGIGIFGYFPNMTIFSLLNYRYGTIEHPTFGRVPRIVTLKKLKAGTEITCHYMICMEEATGSDCSEDMKWYVDLWEEFSNNTGKKNKIDNNDKMDQTSDIECNNSEDE